MTDKDQAIKQIKDEIKDLNHQIKMLENLENIDLTEDNYHQLCNTILRSSDILGQMLAQKLNVSFSEVSPNYFHFTLDNGWKLDIPSSNLSGVDLRIPNYLSDNELFTDLVITVCNSKDKLQKVSDFLEIKDISYRAHLLFPRTRLKTLRYIITNPINQYQKRYSKEYNKLKIKVKLAEENYYNTKRIHKQAYELQKQFIDRYASELFKWTSTIRIHDGDNNYIKKTICKEDIL